MAEESTTPDLVELVRRLDEAANRLDFDAAMSFYAPDAVVEGRASGMTLEGRTAIRGFFEDMTVAYEEFESRSEEILDLGNGVVFVVSRSSGRPVGGTGRVENRVVIVAVWEEGLVVRATTYTDIDEARAAAERLAEERGWAMPENLDLVRSIYADWERGDFGRNEWADPDFELVVIDGPTPGEWSGARLEEGTRSLLGSWKDLRVIPQEYRELDAGRVLVLLDNQGHGKTSGMDLHQIRGGANLLDVRAGKVTRLVIYWDRDRALADLGLEE